MGILFVILIWTPRTLFGTSHSIEDFASRKPCLPDSRSAPDFKLQTLKITGMSKPIRPKKSTMRVSSRFLLWPKTADRQRRTSQATAHAKERPASPPPPLCCLALPLPRSSTPSSATSLITSGFCDASLRTGSG